MKGVCKVCGCTDDNACMTDDGPCHWITMDQNWCSACALEVPADPSKNERCSGWLIDKSCMYCANLIPDKFRVQTIWTCDLGRFDGAMTGLERAAATYHHWFVWSGIRSPNKTVKAAQAHCPHWTLYERFREITRKGRT